MSRPKLSEAELLERNRVALENAEQQPEIASAMSELGYDATKIAEGKTLLAENQQAYNFNKTEDDETSEAYNSFTANYDAIDEIYRKHRKKAKVIYRKDPLMLAKLNIDGSIPRSYAKWLETVQKFYTEAIADTAIQEKLASLKISLEELNSTQAQIGELKTARANYRREVGESQEATKKKDAAFAKIDDWMSEFYAVARIALEDQPQLLEALGKVVKS
ncbi:MULTISPECIES: hypothetical protein [Prolixibacter]|uniref:Uncharacterized protein n=1 Tax=Prolixibacter denitrificans TaxID=1541063 RepID=A0A2P8C637_9BACT|nr:MULTISPECIES: hypothetical protein [Prolixibacter]PSK80424.1 hypothetical protein CLV93_1163 [Prolixibacter denitrificans]GET23036.1 hypothetical protein JCM18694_32820 [Prolixibacter denitrificans]GET25885.1 hypothetical protein NT017_22140 [Prolixibacter sp. NT017]